MQDTKVCTGCGRELPATLEHFYAQSDGRAGLRPDCKACCKARVKARARGVKVAPRVDADGLKACCVCLERKPDTHEFFPPNYAIGKGLRANCRACELERQARERDARRARQGRVKQEYPKVAVGADGLKPCLKCGERKPATTEYFSPSGPLLKHTCKRCAAETSAVRRRDPAYREREREYRDANRDNQRAYERDWIARNPEKKRAAKLARRARAANAPGKHSAADIRRQRDAQGGRCFWCGSALGPGHHVDHLIALSRGGTNDASNLVLACQRCNTSKGDKLPTEWINRPE